MGLLRGLSYPNKGNSSAKEDGEWTGNWTFMEMLSFSGFEAWDELIQLEGSCAESPWLLDEETWGFRPMVLDMLTRFPENSL